MKQKLIKKLEEWYDENVKKGDLIRTSSTDIVIVFQVVK